MFRSRKLPQFWLSLVCILLVTGGAGLGASPTMSLGLMEGKLWTPDTWAVIPFCLMLLCIAVIPLISHRWWEQGRNQSIVSCLLGFPVLIYTYMQAGPDAHEGLHRILHTSEEYISFIFLLGSLYIISGGIVITGNLLGTPRVNTAFLAVGALLASFIGTTGAAMLLIRPILKTNSERKHRLHTVLFFIFIVCNCGGLLTPLGDPPLFLGYLKGVPFVWTFGLWKEWLFVCAFLLAIYYVFDSIKYRTETPQALKLDVEHERPLVILGGHNFLFLGGVIVAVAFLAFPYRELAQLALAVLAFRSTRRDYRKFNGFTFGPILEVVIVFAGIFATMIPALALLQVKGSSLMSDPTPMAFFWATGILSSFLDNAPTYLSFLALSNGIGPAGYPAQLLESAIAFSAGYPAIEGQGFYETQALVPAAFAEAKEVYVLPVSILSSISLGAVFMGAMTYIGNGPNFMVRAIAQESGLRMPSFFGYMLWSALIMLPVLVVFTLVFI